MQGNTFHTPVPCRGGMIFTFYRAQGYSVGASLVEEDKIDLAKELIETAKVGRRFLCGMQAFL